MDTDSESDSGCEISTRNAKRIPNQGQSSEEEEENDEEVSLDVKSMKDEFRHNHSSSNDDFDSIRETLHNRSVYTKYVNVLILNSMSINQ